MSRQPQVTPIQPDESGDVIALPSPKATSPTVDSVVFKVVATIVLLGGAFVGSTFAIIDRTEAAIEKHESRPHKDAATKEDIKRLEAKIDRLIENSK